MKSIYIVFACIVFSVSACSNISKSGEATLNGIVDEYGIYAIDKTDEHTWVSKNSTSPLIHENRGYLLINKTSTVPLKKGITFGLGFTINNCKSGPWQYDLTIVHPKIIKPDGKVSYGYTGKRDLYCTDGKVSAIRSYTFDHDYEMSAGEWKFEVRFNGNLLLEKSFNIVK